MPPGVDLPTGTVTFLFTDVEGSTALLRRLKDGYAEVLVKHERLLRDAAEAAGGQEFGTQGDAVFFVFRNPRDAVLAAVDGQRALETAEWPEGVQIRVRMGIHTGEAAIAADRYMGLAVNRAARICGIARGGQILVSPTTHALVEEAEHDFTGISFRDLGAQSLKDFEVVGEAADGREAVAEVHRLRPDVVLMDVRMPEVDGIEATRRLLGGDGVTAKVVMLTTFDMDEYVYEALRAGASGFLLKDVPPEQLVAGIRAV